MLGTTIVMLLLFILAAFLAVGMELEITVNFGIWLGLIVASFIAGAVWTMIVIATSVRGRVKRWMD